MRGYTVSSFNIMLDAIKPYATHASLHTAEPVDGAFEISGGGYARKAVTWGTAANSILSSTGSLVFSATNGTVVTWLGFWGALTGGTFYLPAQLNAAKTVSGGSLTITRADIKLLNQTG